MEIEHFINFKNKWHLVLLDIFILFFWGIIILFIGDEFKKGFPNLSFIVNAPDLIRVVGFFLCLVLLFLLTRVFLKSLSDKKKRNKNYKFRSQDWPREWIFNGVST